MKSFSKEEFAITWARLSNLLGKEAFIRQPVILVVIVVHILSKLGGGAPLLYFLPSPITWTKTILVGYLLIWSFHVFTFLQRGDRYYGINTFDKSIQNISDEGNKSLQIYIILAAILLLQVLLQYILIGEVVYWAFVIALLLHVLPIFIGNNLENQARYLAPFMETVSLCVMMILVISFR